MKSTFIILTISAVLVSCGKSFVETDPATGQEPKLVSSDPNSSCEIVGINQINGSQLYNRLSYQKDTSLVTIQMVYFDSITNQTDKSIRFRYAVDSVIINSTEGLSLDPSTRNVTRYYYRNYYQDSSGYDDEIYTYTYDSYNHLIEKRVFYNNMQKPDYITRYLYDGDNLISCRLYMSDGVTLVLQTELKYDITKTIKPWIYLYGDSFENYYYLNGFKYGKKATNPVVNMTTKIFNVNNGSLIDIWNTSFAGYVLSKDNYVLQVTSNGDMQQGLGILAGTMRFSYNCK